MKRSVWYHNTTMGQKKGQTGNPNGRPKGIQNRATTEFKEAVNNLIAFATPQMIDWLERIAVEDPAKALELIYKFAQFGYPLLQRTQVAGDEENPLVFKDISDVKNKILKAIPQDELDAILAGDN